MYPKLSYQVARADTCLETRYGVFRKRTDGHFLLEQKLVASFRSEEHAQAVAEKLAADEGVPVWNKEMAA